MTRVSFQETDRCRDDVDVEDIDNKDNEDSEECELSRSSMVEVGDGDLHLLGVWTAGWSSWSWSVSCSRSFLQDDRLWLWLLLWL